MSCNRDGVQCQPAGNALGTGDTELIQMTGRRWNGNCKICGGFLRADGGCTRCERRIADGPPVYAVVGLYGGVVEDVKLVADDDQAEELRRSIMKKYGVDPNLPGESEHQVCCVELRGVSPGQKNVELVVDSRGGVVNGVYLSTDPEAPRPEDGEEGDIVEFVVGAPPPTVEYVLNKAIEADERRPFVIVPGESDYIPCQTPKEAIRLASQRGEGAVYVYDPDHHPANDPRTPVAIFVGGQLGMVKEDWQEVVADVRKRPGADPDLPGLSKHSQGTKPTHTGEAASEMAPILPYAKAVDRLLVIRQELGPDYWEQGYTEDDVDIGCERLTTLATQFGLKGEVGVVWAHNDEYGFGGDSDLFYLEEREGKVYGYSLPMPFWVDSEPEAFISALQRIADGQATPDAVWDSDDLYQEDYNWAERGGVR